MRAWRGSSIMFKHDAGHGEVLNDRPAVGPVAARLRGVGHRVAEHPQHLVVGGHRPEALAVGSVGGGLVPPHRRQLPVHPEDVVREAVGEGVEVGQVDLRRGRAPPGHPHGGARLVKNGAPGA